MSLIPERLAEIESKPLHKGNGKSIDTACIMNMVAYVAGEPWSDHPECACPVLTKMAISLNDRLDDEQRQKLAPLIPLLAGTKGTRDDQKARSNFIVWRNITVTFPILLDLIKMTEYADELRLTPQTTTGFRAAEKTLREKCGEIRVAARSTAYAYAYAAVAEAAYAYAAAADAAADAAEAAYAYADAAVADAAVAAANAAANAAAYVAAGSRGKNSINDSAIETLRLACSIKHTEEHK